MEKIIFLVVFAFSQIVSAQDAEVKKTVETFFAGLNAADIEKIKTVCSDKLVLQSLTVHASGNRFSEETAETFYTSVQKTADKVKFEEKILEYKVSTDEHIAQVWAPYEFYINGKLSHKGANSFQLAKLKEGWKIVYILDSRMP